jgi:hypothetical protein
MSRNAGTLIKQSFGQRAKRLGLATTTTTATIQQSSFIDERHQLYQFHNCEFWRWDLSLHKHQELYKAGKCGCFQCLIRWPIKNNVEHPIYPWQQEIFSALQSHKLIAILKARGIGASEFLLRYAMWLCVKGNQMRGKNFAVITGIRENLSIELVNRFRNLLPNLQWNSKEGTAEINGCRLIGYPSKRVKDLRGLTDTKLVIADEFCWFDPADQQQVLPVLEVFRAKSDAQIVLLSSPAGLNDVMYNLYQEPEVTCRYKRLYLPWQKAYKTLFTEREIAQAKKQPNFEQEFELRFGSYGAGTIFNIADIDFAIKVAKQYCNSDYNPYFTKLDYPAIGEERAEIHAIGCDPGFGLSKFGISMVSIMDDKIHVLVAEEHEQVDEDWAIERILKLREKSGNPRQTKIFIDSANIPFIKRLKSCIPDEREDYQNYMDELRKRKLLSPPDEAEFVHYMAVIPVSFSKHGPQMLANLYAFLARGDLVIHPMFHSLISALQSARNIKGRASQFVLDKTSQSLDVLDSLRLALYNFDAGAPELTEEEESEEEEEEELEKIATH